MRRLSQSLVLCLSLAGTAGAQAILGTYTSPAAPGSATGVTLVIQKDAQGKIMGSLSGNGASYALQGEMMGTDVQGSLSANGQRAYFAAHREGNVLRLIMADYGADGKPNYAQGREMVLSAAGTAPASSAGSVAQSSSGSSGNPFASGGAPDKFAGTFASTEVTLSLKKEGAAYSGTIKYRGDEFPATALASGDNLAGTFKVGPQSYVFTAASAGDGKYVNFSTAGTTYMLARSGAAAGGSPLAGGAAPAPSAGGGGSALATTAQDQQLAALLTKNAWCTFSYSSSSTYTGGSGGTTSTSRTVFGLDGILATGSNSETVNTGAAGNVWANGANVQRARWKVSNGQLMLSADGFQWVPQPLKIEPNSNGYPIITSGGKEYMICK